MDELSLYLEPGPLKEKGKPADSTGQSHPRPQAAGSRGNRPHGCREGEAFGQRVPWAPDSQVDLPKMLRVLLTSELAVPRPHGQAPSPLGDCALLQPQAPRLPAASAGPCRSEAARLQGCLAHVLSPSTGLRAPPGMDERGLEEAWPATRQFLRIISAKGS